MYNLPYTTGQDAVIYLACSAARTGIAWPDGYDIRAGALAAEISTSQHRTTQSSSKGRFCETAVHCLNIEQTMAAASTLGQRKSRTRTGCLTCRKKKIKCDEASDRVLQSTIMVANRHSASHHVRIATSPVGLVNMVRMITARRTRC